MKNIIVTKRHWPNDIPSLLNQEFIFINNVKDFTYEFLQKIKPRYIFIPHWSSIVPKEIYENFECIIFHMTDVPFGRGGSPLQNLITRKIYETKMSAIKCTGSVDGGAVYLKRPLSLYGTAEEIYTRGYKLIQEMIITIITENIVPCDQSGEIVRFSRRKPEESNIKNIEEIEEVFDYIRMLDAEGYPKAFIETEYLKFEFTRASLKENEIIADVRIIRKDRNYE